jgi:hypothetical protein
MVEYLWLTTTTRRQKNRNWQVQLAVALSIAHPRRPSRHLEIRGRVERIVPDPEGAEFVRLAERYGMPQGPPPDAADRIAVVEHTHMPQVGPAAWARPPRRSLCLVRIRHAKADGHRWSPAAY